MYKVQNAKGITIARCNSLKEAEETRKFLECTLSEKVTIVER